MAVIQIKEAQIKDSAITTDKLAGSIPDSKLAQLSTANKVALSAIDLDGATDIGAALADADLIFVDDGAGGTNKKAALSRLPTYLFGKVSGDATIASNGALTIAAGAVENSMLADDAVGADELASNAVVTASIVDANVTTDKLAADAVTGAKLADDAVDSEHIVDGSIDLAHMSANSVDSDQYVDGSIDTAHIADAQITLAKMAANSVDSNQYVDGSIDTAHLGDSQVTTAKIADNAVSLAKMAGLARGKFIIGDSNGDPSALTLGSSAQILISDGSDLAYASISGDATIAANGALTIANDAVEQAMIADDAVGADQLAANAVVFASIDSNAYSTDLKVSASSGELARADAIKSYVDSVVAGVDVKASVVAAVDGSFTMASSASSSTLVLANGEGGFDASANTFTVDGVSVGQGKRVLIKDAVNSAGSGKNNKWNGVYTVGALDGDTLTLTRADDFNAASEFVGAPFFMVESGTKFGAHGFVSEVNSSITIGTDAITFYQFSAPGQASVAGDGLAMSGNVLSVDIDELTALGGTGLHQSQDFFMFSDNGTEKKISFSNLEDAIFGNISGDATVAAGGALTIAAGAVENSMLADDAVGADELASNAVVTASIVDANVTTAKLADDSVTAGKLSATLKQKLHTVSGGSETTLDLDEALDASHNKPIVYKNGLALIPASSPSSADEYSVSVNGGGSGNARISFGGALSVGDIILVLYIG